MALTNEQETKIQDVLELARSLPKDLTKFQHAFLFGDEISREKGFKSIEQSFEEYGSRMRVSDKQWKVINEIYEKLA